MAGICSFRIKSSDWTFVTDSFELCLVVTTKKELANKNLHADNEFCVLACVQKLVDRNTEVESQNHEDEKHFKQFDILSAQTCENTQRKTRMKILEPSDFTATAESCLVGQSAKTEDN